LRRASLYLSRRLAPSISRRWKQGEEWAKAFDDTVHQHRLLKHGPKFLLELIVAGNMCGKSNAHSCREIYEFIGGGRTSAANRR
jgi:hypothetical protein